VIDYRKTAQQRSTCQQGMVKIMILSRVKDFQQMAELPSQTSDT